MMPDAWNPLVLILLVAAGLCLGLLWQVLTHPQRNRLPWAFHCFLAAITLWLLAYAWEMGSADINIKVLASKVQYLGITVAPTSWLVYSLYYARAGRWLTPLRRGLLCIEPVAIAALVWSNEKHHLIWQQIELLPFSPNFSALRITYGRLFYIHAAYSYGLMIWATVLLLLVLLRSPHLYRRQVLTLLICASAPWIGNIVYLVSQSSLRSMKGDIYTLGPSMFLLLDWTPFGFLVTGFAALWGRWRFRLWDITPIARDAVIEGMLDGVLVLDRQNRVLDLNLSAQTILALPISKAVGLSAKTLFAPWPLLQEVLLRSPQQHRLITHQQTVGEAPCWFEISLSPLYNQRHQIIGQLILWRDVSVQKMAELALAHSRDKAEAASQAKSRFLANMSHELRTPLNAIIGYSELLQEDCHIKGYNELLADLETIRTEGGNLLTLINNLLDFSKVEAGKFSIFIEPFELPPFLRELVRTVTPLMQQKDNQFQLQLDPTLYTMHSDRIKIRQVLLNLLGNAAKFTRQGLVILTVEPINPNPDTHDEGWIRFQVQDTGIGMTPEQLPHIFQAFIQADESITRRYGGTGLGLALSQSFCHMMGGAISVESELGVGSTFTMDLPIRFTILKNSPSETSFEEIHDLID
jgi:signal transduction histidine kinase